VPAILHGPRLSTPHRRFADWLRDYAEEHPEVVFSEIQPDGTPRRTTVAEIHDRARRHAAGLANVLDARPAIVVSNSAIDLAAGCWACVEAGVDHGFWSLPPHRYAQDLAGLMTFAGELDATILVTSRRDRVAIESAGPGPVVELDSVGAAVEPDRSYGGEHGGSLFMATSGSGQGFRIVRRHLDEVTRRLTPSQRRSLTMFELSSITGGQGTLTRLAGGLHYVSPAHFLERPETLLDVIERERIQFVSVPPSTLPIVSRLLHDASGRDLTSIETFSLGSELISAAAVAALEEALRAVGCEDVKMSVGYGMTEVGLICGKVYEPSEIELLPREEPVPLGGAWAGRSIRIVDQAGRTCPSGIVGEVEVLTEERLFVEYVGSPDATADAFTEDGWFRTHDLGVIEDGSLTLVGRRSGGPADEVLRVARLEAQMRTTSGIAVGQLWLSPSDERYEAVYVAEDRLTPSASLDLQSALEASLLRESDLLVDVHRVAASNLPLTRTGKIHRPSLGAVPRESMPIANRIDASEIRRDVEVAWMRSLDIGDIGARRPTYAEAGGTSLGLLGLIAAIERAYGTRLSLGDFLGHPTVEGLIAATTAAVLEPSLDRRDADGPAFVRALLGTWPGKAVRRAPHLRVANRRGSARPLVWIFNWEHEYRQLIGAMGDEQPIYASRSFVALPGVDYQSDSVTAMAELLVEELDAAGVLKRDPVLGANCQAAILVLELAARLTERGDVLDRVVLLDAVPSAHRYVGPVTVLVGDDDVHGLASDSAEPWRLAAAHGDYFIEPGLSELARMLAGLTVAPRRNRRWWRGIWGAGRPS